MQQSKFSIISKEIGLLLFMWLTYIVMRHIIFPYFGYTAPAWSIKDPELIGFIVGTTVITLYLMHKELKSNR